MDPIIQKLLSHALFDPLNESDLELIRDWVLVRPFKKGEVVYRVGDPSDAFYLVTAGQFAMEYKGDDGEMHPLNFLYPNEFFGDLGLMEGRPRETQVRSVTGGEVLLFPQANFFDMLDAFPAVEQRLTEVGEAIDKRTLQRFEGQHTDEVILSYERRHWIVLLKSLLGPILFLLLWFGGLIAANYGITEEATQELVVFAALGLLLLPVIWVVWIVLDWLNDYYIVTNERVIHIERVIGLKNERYEAPLSKIQNVNVLHPTPVGEMLGYGQLVIATAAQGDQGAILLDHMPHAEAVAERIINELNQEKSALAQMEQERKRATLRKALGFEPEPSAPGAAPDEPPPAPADPTRGLIPARLLAQFLYFITPIMREQSGAKITWRKHWIILLLESAPAYFALLVVVVTTLAVELGLLSMVQDEPIARYGWAIGLGLSFLLILWLLYTYVDWRNDLYILTPEAILDEEKLPFGFKKEVRRAPLETIQDIQFYQNNPFMVWFGVGNVVIQTAGQQGRFTFDWVKDPRRVQDDIFRYIQMRKEQRRANEAAAINQELVELLRMYEDERRRAAERQQAATFTPDPNDPDATRPSASV